MAGRAALLALALSAAACGRCGGSAPAAPAGPTPVALVNGEPVAPATLARELRQTQAGGEGEGPGDVLRRRVLDDLVDRALLLQQARARSVVVGQDQVERAFLRIRNEYPGTHFDDMLAQERLSQGELKARLKDQLTVERLFHEEVFPRVRVEDAEVDRWYADHAAEFQEAEKVRVLQVVVASRDEAARVREQLRRDPAAFAEVARRASIAPEGKNGGDLGWIEHRAGFPEVFEVCFTLPLNTLSEVTPSPYGFHLFKVVEKKPASRRALEQARAGIAERLLRDKRARAQEEYLATLRARATIQIDQAALAAVTP
ncbi:MAG: peptidyl-prolyl cis-trans isomerase [Anaeromyxobacter sp.]|nr:peptidyl-prolyl cis-trans isomerase [Anaeromyxobacter sp.]MBL0278402.1 peptidyl-prolyl cis-trans isomerase [Anaeromyxobacter sp.]